MAEVIDADTHIIEPPEMWDHLDEELYSRRPVVVRVPNDTLYGTTNAMWLIDGQIFPRPGGKGGFRIATPSAQERQQLRRDVALGSRELTDPAIRVADMDKDDVSVQVVYPTLFLIYVTPDPVLEAGLARAYNAFIGEACAATDGRIRWVAVLPFNSVDASIAEMHRAAEAGASGLFFMGMAGERSLADPYMFPIYEEAAKLGMPICIHIGSGNPALNNVFDFHLSGVFASSSCLPIVGFRDIVLNRIPERFPDLKFGLLEATASWVPHCLYTMRRQFGGDADGWGPRLFEENRIYIACEVEEDIPYLLNFIGEDHLMMGSDYAHTDPAREAQMTAKMKERTDVPRSVIDKALGANARLFYNL